MESCNVKHNSTISRQRGLSGAGLQKSCVLMIAITCCMTHSALVKNDDEILLHAFKS
jgi:hypothetical protein